MARAEVVSRGRASLLELRARFLELHGPRKVARAEALALLSAACAVLEGWSARHARAEVAFAAAWRLDEAATFRSRASRKLGGRLIAPRRWRLVTWRALQALAEAKAAEGEWFLVVADLMVEAARATEADTPPRQVVLYDDGGEPFSLFTKEGVWQ